MLRARGSSFLMLSIQPFFSLSRHTGHGHQAGHAPCVQFPWEEWLNGERFSAAAVLGGVRVAELELAAHQILLIVELGALQIDRLSEGFGERPVQVQQPERRQELRLRRIVLRLTFLPADLTHGAWPRVAAMPVVSRGAGDRVWGP